jgi:hypothetical protein
MHTNKHIHSLHCIHKLSLSLSLSLYLSLSLASQLAFDQYGQLSEQFEQESALRERAESMATEVGTVLHVYPCIEVLCTRVVSHILGLISLC